MENLDPTKQLENQAMDHQTIPATEPASPKNFSIPISSSPHGLDEVVSQCIEDIILPKFLHILAGIIVSGKGL